MRLASLSKTTQPLDGAFLMGGDMSEVKTQYYTCDNCKEPCDPVKSIELCSFKDEKIIVHVQTKYNICEKCFLYTLNRKLSTTGQQRG